MKEETSRPEAAFVLLLMQATFWFAAGLSALPFALAHEIFEVGIGSASFGLAAIALGLGIGVVYRRRGARRWTIALEAVCLVGGLLQQMLPIGANHGSVSLLVNIGVPAVLLVLLLRPFPIFTRAGVVVSSPPGLPASGEERGVGFGS